MSEAFDKVMAGLDDVQAYLDGERDGYGIRNIKVTEPDVASIRNRTGLSQPAFAKSIGVPSRNAEELGAGSTTPGGPGTCAAIPDRKASVNRSGRTRNLKAGNAHAHTIRRRRESHAQCNAHVPPAARLRQGLHRLRHIHHRPFGDRVTGRAVRLPVDRSGAHGIDLRVAAGAPDRGARHRDARRWCGCRAARSRGSRSVSTPAPAA